MNSNIEKIVELAKRKLPQKQTDLAEVFIKEFYGNAVWNDFSKRNTADLCGSVLSHWALFCNKKADESNVKVFNPDVEKDGWCCENTVITIVNKDMPFLVDSLQMALNKLGIRIYTIVHLGGIKVDRDSQGNISKIIPIKDRREALLIEAPIYIEIEKQNDEAILNNISSALEAVLTDVRAAVNDWSAIKDKLHDVINEMKLMERQDTKEEQNFLHWMGEDNFILLGYRCYKIIENKEEKAFECVDNSSLGILKNKSAKNIYQYYKDLSLQALEIIFSENPLILSKTNTVSSVYKACYTDSVVVKSQDKQGKIAKIHRFIGLYASTAYYSSVRSIPFLRRKADDVLFKFGFPLNGYNSKTLLLILDTLPRDDFIQASVDEIYETAVGIFKLHERRLTKLFVRKDLYGRYVSCLVYLPRDNFNTEVRLRIQEILRKHFYGFKTDFDVLFSESILARIHFVIRVDSSKKLPDDFTNIEQEIIEASASWHDTLRESLLVNYGKKEAEILFIKYRNSFPAGYREAFTNDLVIKDLHKIERLNADHKLDMLFYDKPNNAACNKNSSQEVIRFKLFSFNQEISLSDALPILENMGLRIISEQSYKIVLPESSIVWLNDFKMILQNEKSALLCSKDIYAEFEELFAKIWDGEVENDAFNQLVLAAEFNWREISIFRAYAKYLHQIGFPFGVQYLAKVLAIHPKTSRLLLEFFKLRFDPDRQKHKNNSKEILDIKSEIEIKLKEIVSLDEDRVFSIFLNIIGATVRTNYYQNKPYFTFKFACREIQDLPLPKPLFEIFVYAPRFEGTHLRMAKVARGGLRWSDRREDFRTEILGLMKAQQVKNAVIVPYGAKGGFVLKKINADMNRDQLQMEGITCYKNFISALLDITDNIKDGIILRPLQVVCHDEADPYLVVAADKGTAVFSNIANAISLNYGFWLGDAFASGGATGYDHKQIGITARGAFEAVKHHFYELGADVQNSDFSVIGIGDMSGDVFGNGMLLSSHIKLIGAFNHLHIFLDPNPDSELSFKERKRLFEMPQLSWNDYKRELISQGGGVYLRSVKSIPLSPEVRELLQISQSSAAPNEVIRALLKAKVDLLWNGGIGTYVKASSESNEAVGDRSNDAVRVNADELRCKVVSEGGNLGFTQLARIEFSEHGGIINTDFIDNSGGVDCSDHEVNIKIFLNELVMNGILNQNARNDLLASMSDEVSALVLRNNYRQTRVIGSMCLQSAADLDGFAKYIDAQEQANKLNRNLEYLPSSKIILERKSRGVGLMRPEVAILLAYSKLILKEELVASKFIEKPEFDYYLEKEFPRILLQKFGEYLAAHQLRREIISTHLSNDFITNMGITFIKEAQLETEASLEDIVYAYIIAKSVLQTELIMEKIEQLDFILSAQAQRKMILQANTLLRKGVCWFLNYLRKEKAKKTQAPRISEVRLQFSNGVQMIYDNLDFLLSSAEKLQRNKKCAALIEEKIGAELACYIASIDYLYSSFNIIDAIQNDSKTFLQIAKLYYLLCEHLNLNLLYKMTAMIPSGDHCFLFAANSLLQNIEHGQVTLALEIAKQLKNFENETACFDCWLEQKHDFYKKWKRLLDQIKNANSIKLDVLYILAKDLALVV